MTDTIARVSIVVPVRPDRAFTMFVGDIGRWWKKDTQHWLAPDIAIEMRIEPRVGGRMIEVHDAATGGGTAIGTVTAYEPGRRLAMTWRLPFWAAGADSDVEVVFTPAGADATRVEIIHDLARAKLAPDRYASYDRGWSVLLGYYSEHIAGT